MHTYWSLGADGLEWACYKVKKSKDLVESQYKIKLPRNEEYDDEDWIEVYDYYDKEMNSTRSRQSPCIFGACWCGTYDTGT